MDSASETERESCHDRNSARNAGVFAFLALVSRLTSADSVTSLSSTETWMSSFSRPNLRGHAIGVGVFGDFDANRFQRLAIAFGDRPEESCEQVIERHAGLGKLGVDGGCSSEPVRSCVSPDQRQVGYALNLYCDARVSGRPRCACDACTLMRNPNKSDMHARKKQARRGRRISEIRIAPENMVRFAMAKLREADAAKKWCGGVTGRS